MIKQTVKGNSRSLLRPIRTVVKQVVRVVRETIVQSTNSGSF